MSAILECMQNIKAIELPIFRVSLSCAPHFSNYRASVEFRSWYPIDGVSTTGSTPEEAISKLETNLLMHAHQHCPKCGHNFDTDKE